MVELSDISNLAIKIIKIKLPSMDINIEDYMKAIHSIKQYKRKHRYLEIVNISLIDGEKVFISL